MEGGQVQCYIDWGDGTNSGWTQLTQSGDIKTTTHTWTSKGIYNIKRKARDALGTESDWTTYTVRTPTSKPIIKTVFTDILQKFPLISRLLRL